MIVRNGAIALGTFIGSKSSQVDAGLLTKWDGTKTTSSVNVRFDTLMTDVSSWANGITMKLGSGTTPVDFDDYCLESEIEGTKYTCNSAGGGNPGSPTVTNDGKIAFNFTFTANENITVNELCLVYFSDGIKYMFARKNIPTRNVAAGETFTFSYVIKPQ